MASYGYGSYHNGFGHQGFGNSALKNFRKITPPVQTHLKRVYFTLTCTLAAAAVGVYLHLLWNIGGLLTGLGCIASIFYLISLPNMDFNEDKRVNLLMLSALLKGATLGPLIEAVIQIDHTILVTTLVGTVLAFTCFTGAAILARRREFIFLGGLLGSGISILLWLQIAAGMFGGSTAVYTFELYFGLLVFLGYIIYDTQMIIEKADRGDNDYVKHSLDLFTDFAAVFVRLLIILTKNAEGRIEKEKKKRRA